MDFLVLRKKASTMSLVMVGFGQSMTRWEAPEVRLETTEQPPSIAREHQVQARLRQFAIAMGEEERAQIDLPAMG